MTTLPSDLPVVVDRAGQAPLAVQISAQLEAAVTGGVLHAGDRLPSSRDLAATLGVSRTVVTNAYARLFAEGWLEGRHGSGTYVADVTSPSAPGQGLSRERGRGSVAADNQGDPERKRVSRHRPVPLLSSKTTPGSSPPPGGVRGGRPARICRPGGPTRTGCRSSGRRSPPTCAAPAGSPSPRRMS